MFSDIIAKYLAWQKKICEAIEEKIETPAQAPVAVQTVNSSRPPKQEKPQTTADVERPDEQPVVPAQANKPEKQLEQRERAVPESAAKELEATETAVKAAVAQAVQRPLDENQHEAASSESLFQPEAGALLEGGDAPVSPEAAPAQTQEASDEELAQSLERPEPLQMNGWTAPAPVRENPDDVIFQDFPLDSRIMRAIVEDLQFTKCTPIQALTLPHALAGEDIAGRAQTGTGKTATFLISMLQRFLTKESPARDANQPFALALAPTRELAIQIAHDANSLCPYCHFKTVAVYGGMDYDKQRRLLSGNPDLVVATPGRLIDFLKQHVLNLDKVEVLIIDEADRMLDMGFIPDVKRIIYHLKGPETRQTMLFSATLNHDIMRLASSWMRPNPAVMEVEPEHVVAEGIEETVYAVTSEQRLPILLWTLRHEDCHRVLIFRNRRSEVEQLHEELLRFGVASEMLSGDVDQKKRLRILEDFKLGKIQVIVATDVAGRGIHVDDITHVVNYDFPYEAEDYVHRVGRTARAGHKGRAISFADENSAFVIPDIEKYISRSLPISQPEDEMLKLPEEYSNVRIHKEKPHSMNARGGNFHGGGSRGSSGSRPFHSRGRR